MIILLVLVPINHERGIYKNSDPQNLKTPCHFKATMNLEVWGQVDEKYNVLVCQYKNFTPIEFIDCVEFSALLLVEMTLAKNWYVK